MKTFTVTATVLALFAGASLVQAAKEPTLKVGDSAPGLQVSKWVQGDAVKEFQRDKAYIVEFWATWCGPCRVSIPHLNEIHEKFKDKGLVVIGQDVWEKDESLVAPFIDKMGKKMTYRVALDDKQGSEKGKMAETWMEAAGRNGIPSAFVVDKEGKVAWIGHPMQLKESLLEQVLEGKFDLAKAATEYASQQKTAEERAKLSQQFSSQMRKKQWDEADATLTEMEKLLPADEKDSMGMTRFQLLLGKKDYKAAYKLAGQLSEAHPENAMMQNQLAWDIATKQGIEERDLKLAEKIATRANEAAKGTNPAILDTLARVLFLNGKEEKAIEVQAKAAEQAEGKMKTELEETLKSYKKGKLPQSE